MSDGEGANQCEALRAERSPPLVREEEWVGRKAVAAAAVAEQRRRIDARLGAQSSSLTSSPPTLHSHQGGNIKAARKVGTTCQRAARRVVRPPGVEEGGRIRRRWDAAPAPSCWRGCAPSWRGTAAMSRDQRQLGLPEGRRRRMREGTGGRSPLVTREERTPGSPARLW